LIKKTISTLVLLAFCAAPLVATAQHDDHHNDYDGHPHAYVQHQEWKRGYHMDHDTWDRGQRVDYQRYHLNRPPAGYEWREVDGNYVMAAVATGIVASVIAASAR
jgi:Ni/Co efflux regulator RcnB